MSKFHKFLAAIPVLALLAAPSAFAQQPQGMGPKDGACGAPAMSAPDGVPTSSMVMHAPGKEITVESHMPPPLPSDIKSEKTYFKERRHHRSVHRDAKPAPPPPMTGPASAGQ
ncbi:MAG: hypothetical protein AB7W37_08905 [Syntrophobacteraceae bacterium]